MLSLPKFSIIIEAPGQWRLKSYSTGQTLSGSEPAATTLAYTVHEAMHHMWYMCRGLSQEQRQYILIGVSDGYEEWRKSRLSLCWKDEFGSIFDEACSSFQSEEKALLTKGEGKRK